MSFWELLQTFTLMGCNGKILQKKKILWKQQQISSICTQHNEYIVTLEEERETLLGVIEWVVTN